jgi:hypothetical protein
MRAIFRGMRRRRPAAAPHEFEVRMYMPNQTPAMGVIQGVPHVATPTTTRCARDDCGRPQSDPIHRLPGD